MIFIYFLYDFEEHVNSMASISENHIGSQNAFAFQKKRYTCPTYTRIGCIVNSNCGLKKISIIYSQYPTNVIRQ